MGGGGGGGGVGVGVVGCGLAPSLSNAPHQHKYHNVA